MPIGLPELENLCFNEDLCPDDPQRRIALVEKTWKAGELAFYTGSKPHLTEAGGKRKELQLLG